ncbi:MAG: GxxExxY protein [Balneolia bacterium]|nr:GxxExxY protein [Balneolia bacterium]
MEEEYRAIPEKHEDIGREIVNCAIKVHKEMGPGFLENIYELCLAHELTQAGLKVERQYVVPVQYKNIRFEEGYRLDLLVEDCVICELKTVDKLLPIHKAQLLSYLKMTNLRLGYLLNFNSVLMKFGIKRCVL